MFSLDIGVETPLHHFKTTTGDSVTVVDLYRIGDSLYLLIVSEGDEVEEIPYQDLGEATKRFKETIDKYLSENH